MNFKFRIFIIFIITIFSLQSCITTGLKKQKTVNISYLETIFTTDKEAYIFKSNIELYDNHFSGMCVIKPEKNNTYRVVFLSEVGIKFFDIEINPKTYKIHHIFDVMNKKMLVNLLVNDFRLLLMNDIQQLNPKIYSDKENKFTVLRAYKSKNLYFYENSDNKLKKIQKFSIFRKKVEINLSDYHNNFPKSIKLQHFNMNFSLELSHIK